MLQHQALQGYRVRRGSDPRSIAEMHTFSGRAIDVPSQFIAGKSDWGVYQTSGAVDRMHQSACSHMVGFICSMAPDIGCSRSNRNR